MPRELKAPAGRDARCRPAGRRARLPSVRRQRQTGPGPPSRARSLDRAMSHGARDAPGARRTDRLARSLVAPWWRGSRPVGATCKPRPARPTAAACRGPWLTPAYSARGAAGRGSTARRHRPGGGADHRALQALLEALNSRRPTRRASRMQCRGRAATDVGGASAQALVAAGVRRRTASAASRRHFLRPRSVGAHRVPGALARRRRFAQRQVSARQRGRDPPRPCPRDRQRRSAWPPARGMPAVAGPDGPERAEQGSGVAPTPGAIGWPPRAPSIRQVHPCPLTCRLCARPTRAEGRSGPYPTTPPTARCSFMPPTPRCLTSPVTPWRELADPGWRGEPDHVTWFHRDFRADEWRYADRSEPCCRPRLRPGASSPAAAPWGSWPGRPVAPRARRLSHDRRSAAASADYRRAITDRQSPRLRGTAADGGRA
jgi:hypothetical protein